MRTNATKLVKNLYKYEFINIDDIFTKLPEFLKVPFEINKATFHWSGGNYDQASDSYHICIGDKYILVSHDIADRWHSHCYGRNSNNLGLTFMAMAHATQNDAGKAPVTPAMIETMSKALACVRNYYKLGEEAITDHAHWARLDGYRFSDKKNMGNIRWDCEFKQGNGKTITENTLQKVKWYHQHYFEKKDK
tara:strand:- start:9698 stop:10273 length:576 start_codon:yes stop_codon:yes gene_type:complete